MEPAVAVVSACLPIMRSLWIWNREKSEARRSEGKRSQPKSATEHSKGSVRLVEKPRRLQSPQGQCPLNELPGDVEPGWVTKTEINSDYTASTTRNQDSPAYLVRADYAKLPEQSNCSELQPNNPPASNPSRTGSEAAESSGSSVAHLRSALPIQRNESPPSKNGPVQDLSGAYFPGKRHEGLQNEPAELYGSEYMP